MSNHLTSAKGARAPRRKTKIEILLGDIERRCTYLQQADTLNGRNPLVYVGQNAGRIKTAARRVRAELRRIASGLGA